MRSPNTTKIGVSAGTRENPKWHFWFENRCFGRVLEKGSLLSVIHKSCALLKTLFWGVQKLTRSGLNGVSERDG